METSWGRNCFSRFGGWNVAEKYSSFMLRKYFSPETHKAWGRNFHRRIFFRETSMQVYHWDSRTYAIQLLLVIDEIELGRGCQGANLLWALNQLLLTARKNFIRHDAFAEKVDWEKNFLWMFQGRQTLCSWDAGIPANTTRSNCFIAFAF